MPSSKHEAVHVVVVSDNAETLDGLSAYLERVGIPCQSTRSASDPAKVAPAHATAIVLFPDDFAEKTMIELVRSLRRQRPRALVVLVTRSPDRFAAVVAADGKSTTPLVMARPSFGWEIADAIRAHAAAHPSLGR